MEVWLALEVVVEIREAGVGARYVHSWCSIQARRMWVMLTVALGKRLGSIWI